MKKQSNTLFLAQSAMIAAIYVVLTVILAPFSYGEVQGACLRGTDHPSGIYACSYPRSVRGMPDQ